MALFGSKWTSQFGESVDKSGQWGQTLGDVSRAQVAAGLDVIRKSGRVWPPTAPEFREICILAPLGMIKSADQALVEFNRYLASGCRDPWSLSPEVYHTISKNLDMFLFRQMDFSESSKTFHSAYRATIDQLRSGEKLCLPPEKETLLEQKEKTELSEDEKNEIAKKGSQTINSLMGMFK